MNLFKCDICAKETKLNPKVEQVFEEKMVTKEIKDPKTGKTTTGTEVVKTPKMKKIKQYDLATGQCYEREVQETRDLEPRCYIVKLNAGPVQMIQKDFCEDCYKTVLPQINALWATLEQIGSK